MWLKYSNAPILNGEYWDRRQAVPDADGYRSEYEKPRGCWITDDSEDCCWRSWCMSERFGLENLTHKHEVILDETSILILRSAYEVATFSQQFGTAHWWAPAGKHRNWCIEWDRVAASYAGIIITPYQWTCRLDLSWYYSWDCASGCVWKADAIREIRLIEIDVDVTKRPEEAKAA